MTALIPKRRLAISFQRFAENYVPFGGLSIAFCRLPTTAFGVYDLCRFAVEDY